MQCMHACRYYADVMVAFLEDHAWAAAMGSPDGAPKGPPSPLPAPLIPNNYEQGHQCAINEDLFAQFEASQVTASLDQAACFCILMCLNS